MDSNSSGAINRRTLCAALLGCALAACGPGATNAPRGPAIAREGASSGSMSRVGAEDDSIGYVPSPAYPVPGSVPQTAASTLGGDAVREGSFSNPMPIALGQTIQGRLEASDTPLEDGSVADDYVFVGSEGMNVHIELHGGEVAGQPGSHMDMYLWLLRDGVEVTHNDDGGGNLDSLIEATLPATGAYTLRVTTFGSGLRAGAYTLSLRAQ